MDTTIVRDGYNAVAKAYTKSRGALHSTTYLEKMVARLRPKSLILDVGCGAGIPVDKWLVERKFRVIGIDVSESQIALAREYVPEAHFKVIDMMTLAPHDYEVQGIVCLYALFHTPRETHAATLAKFYSYLDKDGILLITMGAFDWEGEKKNFHGAPMAWSQFDPATNSKLVADAGFQILIDTTDTSGDEQHQIILAKK